MSNKKITRKEAQERVMNTLNKEEIKTILNSFLNSKTDLEILDRLMEDENE